MLTMSMLKFHWILLSHENKPPLTSMMMMMMMINVTSEEVARTTGVQREQWLEAGRKEISNLTSKRAEEHKVGALEPINPSERTG